MRGTAADHLRHTTTATVSKRCAIPAPGQVPAIIGSGWTEERVVSDRWNGDVEMLTIPCSICRGVPTVTLGISRGDRHHPQRMTNLPAEGSGGRQPRSHRCDRAGVHPSFCLRDAVIFTDDTATTDRAPAPPAASGLRAIKGPVDCSRSAPRCRDPGRSHSPPQADPGRHLPLPRSSSSPDEG